MNWFADRRRDYILWRLATAGELRRADITRIFGISTPQASADIGALLAECPDAATYDKSAKRYVGQRHAPPARLARLAKLAEAMEWS